MRLQLSSRVVGHVIAVHGLSVTVELLSETHSAIRATIDGVHVAIAINAYLCFSIGAGQVVLGIITDLVAKEGREMNNSDSISFDVDNHHRMAHVQLLGTVQDSVFTSSVTILPTLDTAAEIVVPNVLKALLATPPRRNRPENYDGDDFDHNLRLGVPMGQSEHKVYASYNDLFSRPVAIVGNTGSGKSFTVASIVQKGINALSTEDGDPHVFILDINGEYGRAFPLLDKEK